MINLPLLSASIINALYPNSGTLIGNFENVLGTSLQLKIKASSREFAESAESQILNYISILQDKLGSAKEGQGLYDYNHSNLNQINISTELNQVMSLFDSWNKVTNNAINANTNILTQFWKDAENKQVPPTIDEINEVILRVNEKPYDLLPNGSIVKLTEHPLKLHSLAKGYILENAADFALNLEGVTGIVLNIGGDITAKGDMIEPVRITNPSSPEENAQSLGVIYLENKSIANSGSYKQGFQINGVNYSHIFDPKTALPVQEIAHSSVIHENAITAGALATAMNILSKDESQQLAEKFDQSAFLLIDQNKQAYTSENWSMIPESSASAISFVNTKEKVWNPNLVLQINLEIADLGGYARRPYVAVWVEDENHKPIRRLALWYRKPRWLPDLREFTSTLREVNMDENSIASATRSAGNYSLIWDGKNDAGDFVPQGIYTVFIESAREHGTYQLIKQAVKCDEKIKNIAIPGNPEIASASLILKTK